MMDKTELNQKQLEAVNTLKGNVLVLAGAGTGKTRVLTYRIANLLDNGVEPNNIYAFTFTNKAANEMKSRIKEIVENADRISISTFHSFCFSFLSDFPEYIGYKERFMIIDDEDKVKLIRNIIKDNNLDVIDTDAIKAISSVKNHTSYEYKDLKQSYIINFMFLKYQNILKSYNKMDLDDLLYQFYNLLKQQSFIKEHLQDVCEYILVDECQDTNKIQYEILTILSEQNKNLFLVGDQDQCIYTFRGSNVDNINDFIEYKNAKVIKLEENYRSNQNILNVANNLIKNNKSRLDKSLYTTRNAKEFKVIYSNLETSSEEAIYAAKLINKLISSGYNFDDIAILYRNNFISTSFEKELVKYKIPYQVFGSFPFFKHKEIKTIFHYYQFLFNQNDDLAFKEIYNTPRRKIGDITFNKIEELSKQNNISLYESSKHFIEAKEFINQIQILSKEFKIQSPKQFIKILLDTIKYQDYLIEQVDAKNKMNRLYDFIRIISDIEDFNKPDIATIDFFNQIYFLNDKEEDKKFVKLMTIHQAKGLEFKVVIIAGCNEGIMPSFKSTKKEVEEERRIFYVAITRAKERLYLLSSNKRLVNGKYQYYKPSTFLENINIDNLLYDNFY